MVLARGSGSVNLAEFNLKLSPRSPTSPFTMIELVHEFSKCCAPAWTGTVESANLRDLVQAAKEHVESHEET